MTPTVFALVLVSATIHVCWNALGKRSGDKVAFALATLVVSTLALAPVFMVRHMKWPGEWSQEALVCAAISGLFEALYFALLFSAYHHVDLSVAYPLSRGVAPVFALVAGGLWMNEWVALPEGMAVATILAGVLAVSLSVRRGDGEGQIGLGLLFAVATGAMIAGYHVVDRRAMSLTIELDTLEFLFLKHVFIVLFLATFLLLRGGGFWRRLTGEWRRSPKTVVAVGVMTPLAYFLILLALATECANVTYVTAGRNIGIVLSTLVGKLVLGETVRGWRWVGVVLILGGIAGLVVLTVHSGG